MSRINFEIRVEIDGKTHTLSIEESADASSIARTFIKDNRLDIGLLDSLAENISAFLRVASQRDARKCEFERNFRNVSEDNSPRNHDPDVTNSSFHSSVEKKNKKKFTKPEKLAILPIFRSMNSALENPVQNQLTVEPSSIPQTTNYRQITINDHQSSSKLTSPSKLPTDAFGVNKYEKLSGVHKRLYADAQAKQKRKQIAINTQPQPSTQSEPKISLEYFNRKFYYDSIHQEQMKQELLEKVKKEREPKESPQPFKPEINHNTQIIANSKIRTGRIEERLIEQGKITEDRKKRSKSLLLAYQ